MSSPDEPARPSRASLDRSGALVTALFALAWAFTGTTAVEADTVALGSRLGALVVTAAAVVAAVGIGARRPEHASEADVPADWRRQFNIVGAVQGGAIALVVVIAVVLRVEGLIPAGVCLVVGLHFFPIARVLQMRYSTTGAALCVIGAAGCSSFFTAGADWAVISVGAGAAVTLWSASFRHALTGLSSPRTGASASR